MKCPKANRENTQIAQTESARPKQPGTYITEGETMTDKEFTEAQKTVIRETISRSAELMALLYQLDEEQLDNVYTFIKALSEENNYD